MKINFWLLCQIVVLVLQITGVIHIEWVQVFIPLYIWCALWFIILFLTFWESFIHTWKTEIKKHKGKSK